ncbi:phenylacetic acid degradation operon negative regulatory protein PaaX [Massilia endophytica]|uniref:phenylacetic acid degradation operon negative regulatory protein PaaX n=1 Tax=Massilia endophytica TaxID=2899220 RepID=UPI001E4E605B|nr:phenylacetic acid degradation operon negative regulatory protein PaaX [Massilia endophytica]UGQ45708.1 phenylacetic acid degradation operon negative regulatory protein PaaX [Massilia endophytica]
MQKITSVDGWIAQSLASEPPRAKSLVMTVFGDAIAPHGGEAWLGSLIELLEPFGVNDRLLRTSVFRLAQEGWLGSQRDGRRSAYAITPEAMRRFTRAFRRVYAPLQLHWDGSWTLVLGAGSITAPERTALRKELLWEGYSMIAPGIAAHPAGDAEALDELLGRTGMRNKVYVALAAQLPGVQGKPLADLIAEGWDLSEVVAGYERFVAHFSPLRALLREQPALTPQQAFMLRTLLIHAYRRVQLHDPQLPIELLPDPWPGTAAYELARELYQLSYEASGRHVLAALQREAPETQPVQPAFLERFGGLR